MQRRKHLLGVCRRAREAAADVHDQPLIVHECVANAVAVGVYRPEPSGRDKDFVTVHAFVDVLGRHPPRDLRRRKRPRHSDNLLQERRTDVLPTRDHVEGEQVPVDLLPRHCVLRAQLMGVRRPPQQPQALLLRDRGVVHGPGELAGLGGAASDGLCAPVAVQAHHRGLVRGDETVLQAVVGQLDAHLDKAIRGTLALLGDQPLVQVLERVRRVVQIGDVGLGLGGGGLDDLLQVRTDVPLQPRGGQELPQGARRAVDVPPRVELVDPLLQVPVLVGEHDLHHVADHGGVTPAVLRVQPAPPVREHDRADGLVAPAVGAVAGEDQPRLLGEGLGPVVVQDHREHRALDDVEGRPVLAAMEVDFAGLGPDGAVLGGQRGDLRLVGAGGVALVLGDAAQEGLDLVRRHEPAGGVRDVHAVPHALGQHYDVPGVNCVVLLQIVAVRMWDAGRREHVLVLGHAHRNDVNGAQRLHLFMCNELSDSDELPDQTGGAAELVLTDGRQGPEVGDTRVIGVDQQ
mmetsp:Transcript_44790/g.73069  ORF Transcript_44790/g.73069 Transcript_44790/m.73069 type:complete len:516 (-) Transcript_44790:2-1549(-)